MTIDYSALAEVVLENAESDPLTVRRPGVMETVNGRRRPATDVPLVDIIGSTWPVQGVQLSELEEGKRDREIRDVFTTPESSALQAKDDVAQVDGDIITVDGRDYEVIQVNQWSRGVFGHYLAQRIKRTDGV